MIFLPLINNINIFILNSCSLKNVPMSVVRYIYEPSDFVIKAGGVSIFAIRAPWSSFTKFASFSSI